MGASFPVNVNLGSNRFLTRSGARSGTDGIQGIQAPVTTQGDFDPEGAPLLPGQIGQLSGIAQTAGQLPAISGSDLFQTFRQQIGAPQPIQTQSLLGQFGGVQAPLVSLPTAPTQVQGLSPEFFKAQEESAREALRQEFFGEGGVAEGSLAREAAAGRLGSGVAQRLIQQTVTDPFARASAQISRDVLGARLQEQRRVDELNANLMSQFADRRLKAEGVNVESQGRVREFLGNLALADSKNQFEAQRALQDLTLKTNQLAAQLADAEAGRLDQFDIDRLEREIDAAFKAGQLQNEYNQSKLQFQDLQRQIAGNLSPG